MQLQLCIESVYVCVKQINFGTYRIEGNFGRGKLWQIHYKNIFGEINFGEFIHFSKQKILPCKISVLTSCTKLGLAPQLVMQDFCYRLCRFNPVHGSESNS